MEKLSNFQKEIDKINKEIIISLSKRKKISKKIKEYKQKNNLKIYNKTREKQIFNDLKIYAKEYNLDKSYLNKIFKIIIKNSKKIQK